MFKVIAINKATGESFEVKCIEKTTFTGINLKNRKTTPHLSKDNFHVHIESSWDNLGTFAINALLQKSLGRSKKIALF